MSELDQENLNNGMMTKIWGPPGWLFLHCVTVGYPHTIDMSKPEHVFRKEQTKLFFTSLGHVLPCLYCRDSYNEYIQEHPLTDKILMTRETLSKWLYDIHNLVNEKLNVKDIPTFNEFYNRYELFRSKCVVSKTEPEKGCINSKDGVKKKSVIQIVDKNGNDYCINTTDDMKDLQVFQNYTKSHDTHLLKLLSPKTREIIRNQAQQCITHRVGDTEKAQTILNNI